MHAVGHARGDLVRTQVRQKARLCSAVKVIVAVVFNHKAFLAGHAVLCQQGIQVGGTHRQIGGHKQVAAVFQIGLDGSGIQGGKVRLRIVDQQGCGIFGHCIVGQQVQVLHGNAGIIQRFGKIAFQAGFAVAGQLVQHIAVLPRDLGNAGGQRVLSGEAHCVTAGGIIAGIIRRIHIIVVHHGVVIPAYKDHAGGACVLRVILLCKGGIQRGVALLPGKMAAFARIAVQNSRNVGILAAGFRQVIGGHIGVQFLQHGFGGIAQGEHFAGGNIKLGKLGGHRAHHKVEQNYQHQHHNGQHAGVSTAAQAAAARCLLCLVRGRGIGRVLFLKVHRRTPLFNSSGGVPVPDPSGRGTVPPPIDNTQCRSR